MEYDLVDGDERHAAHPETFDMPSRADRLKLTTGGVVKVGFTFVDKEQHGGGERLWYRIEAVTPGPKFELRRINNPLGPCPEMITVELRHIIDIWDGPIPGRS